MSRFPEEMYCTRPTRDPLDPLDKCFVCENAEKLSPSGPGVWGLVAKYRLVSVLRIKREQSFVVEEFSNE